MLMVVNLPCYVYDAINLAYSFLVLFADVSVSVAVFIFVAIAKEIKLLMRHVPVK